MRAREFVREDADGQQVLDYIHGTHHEPLTKQLQQAVLSYPQWELRSVPVSSLHIPDQEYDDEEQEPEADPYNRVQAIDPDHAGEYSANFVDRRPIVVDADGWIIDGNHRAWAAAELLNRSTIRAWVPAKQGVKENTEQKPVVIYTDNKGATIDDGIKKSLRTTQEPFDKLQMWEKHKSMKDPKIADWVTNKLLPELKQNGVLKPLLVWNNNGQLFVIDGNHRFLAYQAAGYRGRVPVQIVPDNMITISDTVPGQQSVAESVNDYLWHGSKIKHSVLYPQQANDTGGKKESNKNAVYATPNARVAIAMGLTTPGSDTGMFPNDPQMVLFKGGIRKGQMVYLHKVPKDLFIKHNDREWYSKPGVKEVKPLEVVTVPVDKYLDLIRQATPQDLELRKKYMKQEQGVAESQLNELGNAPADYKPNRKRSRSLFHATVDGQWVDVFFDRSEFNGTLHITFAVNGDYDAPEQPTSASKSTVKILSTVLNIVKKQLPEYMAKARPPAISFTSKQDNRTSLYRKYFVPVIQNILGPKWQHEEYPSMGMTVFHWKPVKKSGVTEAFDQPYAIQWTKQNSDWHATADLDDGSELVVLFMSQGDNQWMVEFERDENMEITGEGDAPRVFATVLTAMQQFIAKRKPAMLNFSAEKEDDPTGSRARLYDRMIQRYVSGTGYDLTRKDYPGGATYTLTKQAQGVAENKQPGKPVADAILKVMPLAQEIWFHGSRAIGQHRNDSDTDILVVVPDDLVGDKYLGVVRILQKLSSHFDNHDIQPTKAGTNIHRIAQEEGRLLWSKNQGVAEDTQLPGDFKLMGQNLFLKNLARNLKQRYPDATVKLSSDRVTAYHNEGDDEALSVMGTEVMDSGYIGVGLDDAFTESFQGVLVPTIKQTTEQLLAANPGTKPALFLSTDNWNPDAWTHIASKLGYRLVADDEELDENFADGRNPQDKGDSKRHGINTKASVSSLRKTAKQGGRKGQLAHWLANMKSGRAKAKKK